VDGSTGPEGFGTTVTPAAKVCAPALVPDPTSAPITRFCRSTGCAVTLPERVASEVSPETVVMNDSPGASGAVGSAGSALDWAPAAASVRSIWNPLSGWDPVFVIVIRYSTGSPAVTSGRSPAAAPFAETATAKSGISDSVVARCVNPPAAFHAVSDPRVKVVRKRGTSPAVSQLSPDARSATEATRL